MGGAGGVGSVAGGRGAGGDSSALPRGAPGTRSRPHPPQTSLGARGAEPLSRPPRSPSHTPPLPRRPSLPAHRPSGREKGGAGRAEAASPGRGLPGRGPCVAVCGDRPRRGRHALCAGGCEEHLNWRAGEAGSGCYYCRERESAGEPASGELEQSRSGPAGREVGRGDLDFETPAVPALCPLDEPSPSRARTSPVRGAPGGDALRRQPVVPSEAALRSSAATGRAWGAGGCRVAKLGHSDFLGSALTAG